MQEKYKIIPKLTPSLFAYFVSRGKWKFPAHLNMIEKKIFDALSGKKRFLIINMPPRHGKSEFLSKYFPLWFLLNYPEKRVILASYQQSLSETWSRRIRELIMLFGPLFGIKLNPSNRKQSSFSFLNHSGSMLATGVGGALTGQGADLLIIDDPVKNDAEANSATRRENIWDWFNATALTRLEPNGICILIIKQNSEAGANRWDILSLPAIAEEDDALGRKPGEALWKERFSAEDLANICESIGSYWFSSLYQQNPVPAGNSIFRREHFKYFEEFDSYYNMTVSNNITKKVLKSATTVFAVSDLALSLKETADFTVVLVFAKLKSGDILILDVIRERFESTEHLKLFSSVNAKYKPILIGIESVQFQQSLIQQAVKSGLPIKSLKPDKDKISRALPIAALLENGKIFFKRNAGYLEVFEKELLQFPKSKHDDQVDAFAYIVQLLNQQSGLLPV
jgi:predicted phage terminase large subunit-like protein